MRYQYVSLVHLLRHGTFPELLGNGDILWQMKFPTYTKFFQRIIDVLAPNEFCDCIRHEYHGSFAPFYEDRYYRDEARNITVTYIMYFGDTVDVHGHYRSDGAAGEVREDHWQFSEIYTFLEHLHGLVSPPRRLY